MGNEKFVGKHTPHTTQLMRLKTDEFEFSIYKRRQAAKGRRSCTTRVWLLKRFFATGLLLKGRITALALEELEPLAEADKLTRCEELLANAKQRSTMRETPERAQ